MSNYSVNVNAVLNAASSNILIGDGVCLSTDGTTYVKATTANLAAAGGVLEGFSRSNANPGGVIDIQQWGHIPASVTGLATGSATYLTIDSAARPSRTTNPSGALGNVYTTGAIFLTAIQGSGGGGGGISGSGTTNNIAKFTGSTAIENSSISDTGTALSSSGTTVAWTANGASSFTTSSGGLTLTAAGSSVWSVTTGTLGIDAGGAVTLGGTNATGVAVGHSGITTTITGGFTQLTGAFSLTGNGASSLTTIVGNTTIDSAASVIIGASTATGIAMGKSGITTAVTGNFTQGTGTFSVLANGASQLVTTAGALTIASNQAATWSTTNGGLALTSAGTATWSVTTGNLTLDAGGGLNLGTVNATSISIGKSGTSTTITGGGIACTAAAASSFTTSAGALTLTSNQAATWSTTNGALTLQSAAAATWSSAAGNLTIDSAAVLQLGTSAATGVSIGATGNTSTFLGNMKVGQAMLGNTTGLKTTNYTVTSTDYFVRIGTLGGAITVTLPASPVSGLEITIKDTNGTCSGTNTVTISGNGINIDGSASSVQSTAYFAFTALYDGTVWSIQSTQGSSGSGITTLTGDVTASGSGSVAATIAAAAVSLAKMANLAANSIIGNNTGSPATPIALTVAQTNTLLGTTTGSGTANTLTKFTGTATVGNCQITDDGSTIAIPGVVNIGTAASLTTQLGSCKFNQGIRLTSTTLKTANYTSTTTDHHVRVGTLSGAITITMTSGPATTQLMTVQDVNGTCSVTNTITVSGNGKNINGAGTFVLNTAYASMTMSYDGTSWTIWATH